MKATLSEEQVNWIYGALDMELSNNEFGLDIENYLKTSYDKQKDIKEYIGFIKLCYKFEVLTKEEMEKRIKEVKKIKGE